MKEALTYRELLTLFRRNPEDLRGIGQADSVEFLNIATYLVYRGPLHPNR